MMKYILILFSPLFFLPRFDLTAPAPKSYPSWHLAHHSVSKRFFSILTGSLFRWKITMKTVVFHEKSGWSLVDFDGNHTSINHRKWTNEVMLTEEMILLVYLEIAQSLEGLCSVRYIVKLIKWHKSRRISTPCESLTIFNATGCYFVTRFPFRHWARQRQGDGMRKMNAVDQMKLRIRTDYLGCRKALRLVHLLDPCARRFW
jgi:hypothetical protein